MLQLLFPIEKRTFFGKRYLNITLRTCHLISMAGLAGLFLFALDSHSWLPYVLSMLITGTGMVLIEVYADGIWFIQLRGIAVMSKLFLLLIAYFVPIIGAEVFIAIIALSGFFSHAPSKLRYYVPFLDRVVHSSAELRELGVWKLKH